MEGEEWRVKYESVSYNSTFFSLVQLLSAEKAVKKGQTAVVITNGHRQGDTVLGVVRGQPVGTLITQYGEEERVESVDVMATKGW